MPQTIPGYTAERSAAGDCHGCALRHDRPTCFGVACTPGARADGEHVVFVRDTVPQPQRVDMTLAAAIDSWKRKGGPQ